MTLQICVQDRVGVVKTKPKIPKPKMEFAPIISPYVENVYTTWTTTMPNAPTNYKLVYTRQLT